MGRLRRGDLQQPAAAVAAGIFAVELDEGVFAQGQRAAGSDDMDAARFAGGKFGETGVKGCHKVESEGEFLALRLAVGVLAVGKFDSCHRSLIEMVHGLPKG